VGYEENGQLAKWFAKAPKLWALTTPSAPNAKFFEVEHESLYSMRVNAGYDPQDFILNLSRKSSPLIWNLDWSEVQNNLIGAEEAATPYEHFEALFSSTACPGDVTLRNPKLSEEQVKKLGVLQRETCRGRSSVLTIYHTYYGLRMHADSDGSWFESEPGGKWRNSRGKEGDYRTDSL
jgi:hypothetical protein